MSREETCMSVIHLMVCNKKKYILGMPECGTISV